MHDFTTPAPNTDALHFTQLVWNDSTKLGMSLGKAAGTGKLVCTAKYDKKGNIPNEYLKNVFPLKTAGGQAKIVYTGTTTTTTTTTTKAAAVFNSITSECLAAFRAKALSQHNALRAMHGAQTMTQDSEIDSSALVYAQYLASTGKFEHSDSDNGENLFYKTFSSGLTIDICSSKIFLEIF